MKCSRTHIVTATGAKYEIPMEDARVRAHFEAPSSYTDEILRQINEAKFYDPIFKGRSDLVFFDIGANIGLVSLYAQDVCREVVAVEPSEHFVVLRKLAEPFPHIRPTQWALHSRNAPVELKLFEGNTTGHSTVIPVGSKSMIVPGATLSVLLGGAPHIDVVKVDIEGAEMTCLTDEELDKVRDKVSIFYVEAHSIPGQTFEQSQDILYDRLKRHGYATSKTDNWGIIAK